MKVKNLIKSEIYHFDLSNTIFDKKILSVLPSSVVVVRRRPSVVPVPVPRPPKKLRYFRVFSLFNVILCRLPGGARQYPRSGYFLVLNKDELCFLTTRYSGSAGLKAFSVWLDLRKDPGGGRQRITLKREKTLK